MATLTPEITKKLADKPYPLTVRALAEKWGPVFDVSPSWIVAHCYVESSNRPLAHNERGNAWGLMQIKPGTAEDIVRLLRASGLAKRDPGVGGVLRASWRGQGEDLWNPELNVMLGASYLGYIKRKFKTDDHDLVAAAYNQGPGAAMKALRSGEFKPTEAMVHYITKISEAKAEGYA